MKLLHGFYNHSHNAHIQQFTQHETMELRCAKSMNFNDAVVLIYNGLICEIEDLVTMPKVKSLKCHRLVHLLALCILSIYWFYNGTDYLIKY